MNVSRERQRREERDLVECYRAARGEDLAVLASRVAARFRPAIRAGAASVLHEHWDASTRIDDAEAEGMERFFAALNKSPMMYPRAYAFVCGRNTARSIVRADRRDRRREERFREHADKVGPDPEPGPYETLEEREEEIRREAEEMLRLTKAKEALAALFDHNERWAIAIRAAAEGVSKADLATELGVKRNTLNVWAKRGREWILDWLEEHDPEQQEDDS